SLEAGCDLLSFRLAGALCQKARRTSRKEAEELTRLLQATARLCFHSMAGAVVAPELVGAPQEPIRLNLSSEESTTAGRRALNYANGQSQCPGGESFDRFFRS